MIMSVKNKMNETANYTKPPRIFSPNKTPKVEFDSKIEIQWNLPIVDTHGSKESVHYRQLSTIGKQTPSKFSVYPHSSTKIRCSRHMEVTISSCLNQLAHYSLNYVYALSI